MTQAPKTGIDGRRRSGRHGSTARSRGVGLVGLLTGPSSAPLAAPVRDETDPTWAAATRRVARFAAWALPLYAACSLWLALTSPTPVTDPGADPAAWAARVTEGGYLARQLLAGPGLSLLGLVALVGLATLLAGARGRGAAAAGLLAGLAAVTLWLPRQGLAAFAAPTLAGTADPAPALRSYVEMYERASGLAGTGEILFTASWVLFGVAVWRSRVLNRADGVLLVLAAPLLGVAARFHYLPVALGALLLLAAGVGIAWNAGRAAQSAAWPSTSTTPTTSGSPTTAR